MHPLLKRSLLFVGAIIVVLALLVWGIGMETIKARLVDLVYLGQQHMILVFSSMFFALLVGIPAGILLSRPAARGIAEYVMQIFNVGNTLPPLAVLALAMVVIGIGDTPAIIALFLASLLPIVRNTYAGLCSVPPSLLEAANAAGLDTRAIVRAGLPDRFIEHGERGELLADCGLSVEHLVALVRARHCDLGHNDPCLLAQH